MIRRYGKENLTRLAKEARLGPGTASRIKASETSIGIDVVEKVAKALKVPVYCLLVPPHDRTVVRLIQAYNETDERGKLGLDIAVENAERRRDVGIAGTGKTGTADD